MDPATIALIGAAVSEGSKQLGNVLSASQQKKAAKRRAKETKRETFSGLLNEALQRSADLEAHRMQGKKKMGMRKGQSFQDTADLVRGALRS